MLGHRRARALPLQRGHENISKSGARSDSRLLENNEKTGSTQRQRWRLDRDEFRHTDLENALIVIRLQEFANAVQQNFFRLWGNRKKLG